MGLKRQLFIVLVRPCRRVQHTAVAVAVALRLERHVSRFSGAIRGIVVMATVYNVPALLDAQTLSLILYGSRQAHNAVGSHGRRLSCRALQPPISQRRIAPSVLSVGALG